MSYPDYSPYEYEQFAELEALNGMVFERMTGSINRAGVWNVDQPIICRFSTFLGLNPGYAITDVAPEYGTGHPILTWLTVMETRFEQLKADWVRLVINYQGATGTGPLVNRNRAQSRTAPIAQCPKLAYVKAWCIANATTNGWDGSTTDSDGNPAGLFVYDGTGPNRVLKTFGINAGRYQGGENFEDQGGIIHSVTYYSQNHSDRWSNYKNIDTPKGDYPDPPTGENWMLDDIQEDSVGFGYQITETWKTSGPQGWDPIIYGTATS